jgi:hypothetical protein
MSILESAYRKVIPARFVTRKNGTPMQCEACGTDLVMGQAFAATPGTGWVSYCATCAATPAFAGLVKVALTRLVTVLDGADVPADVVTAVQHIAAQPTNAAAFLDAMGSLSAATTATVAAKARAENKVKLAGEPLYEGLVLAIDWAPTARERDVAESFVTQWETKGYLSERQASWAESIVAKARKAEAKAQPPAPDYAIAISAGIDALGLLDGYYAIPAVQGTNDLTFVRITTADSGQRRMLHIVGGKPEVTPGEAWCNMVLDGIRILGAATAMARYGQTIGRCGKCHRRLTDQASRSAGIGPVCVTAI